MASSNSTVETTEVAIAPSTQYYWRIVAKNVTTYPGSVILDKSFTFTTTTSNVKPVVDAGPDGYAFFDAGSAVYGLSGTVIDDGRAGFPLTTTWTVEPTTGVTIADPSALMTAVEFAAGAPLQTYVFTLTANDTEFIVSDTANVVLYADGCTAAKAQSGYTRLSGDINDDCTVDLKDFSALASQWLETTSF